MKANDNGSAKQESCPTLKMSICPYSFLSLSNIAQGATLRQFIQTNGQLPVQRCL